jgi:hypothetical protein
MYIVKNTGTMVIGFPKSLAKTNDEHHKSTLSSLSEQGNSDDEEN